jgi:hypothetical protein
MNTKTRWALLALLVVAAGCLMAFDATAATHLFLIGPAVAITLEELPALATALQKKQDEVAELGRQVLADNEAGRKSSDELKVKLDEALTGSGEMKQRLTELEQAVAKGLKAANDEPAQDDLGAQMQKAFDEDEELQRMQRDPRAFRGKALNIAVSRKALTNSGVTGTALNFPGRSCSPPRRCRSCVA